MIILLHSSKTMKHPSALGAVSRKPVLQDKAVELGGYLKQLSITELARVMHISAGLAAKTHDLMAAWNTKPDHQSVAIDSFVGDIYSGFRAGDMSQGDRDYADQVLRILSGLYGLLRPYDGICPYRLEMGYRLQSKKFADLYDYWGDSVAKLLPKTGLIINLSSVEYMRVVNPYVDPHRVVAPQFLTINPKDGKPTFTAVHAKIARGAFARWLVQEHAEDDTDLTLFTELGYAYDEQLSSPERPTFVCRNFGGIGLSIRLT